MYNKPLCSDLSLRTMSKKVRVRFAPSPTGGLHLGGVRTLLYNYLFARQHKGSFVLRIEDTDQTRFVPGAEDYIHETMKWCGLEPDESPLHGGDYGPYRQSERKPMYKAYAEQLVKAGKAYYAFDRPDELDSMRTKYRTAENPSPQYDHSLRMSMRNSLSLTLEETERMLEDETPYVIRIMIPEHETVSFTDMIRGEVSFSTSTLDDKVLLKADSMPTYHLAVVVDDFLMKISHAFRGEEWLSSAPIHILLWRYLFGEENMPQWAHFPLILFLPWIGKIQHQVKYTKGLKKEAFFRKPLSICWLSWAGMMEVKRKYIPLKNLSTGFPLIGYIKAAQSLTMKKQNGSTMNGSNR